MGHIDRLHFHVPFGEQPRKRVYVHAILPILRVAMLGMAKSVSVAWKTRASTVPLCTPPFS